MLSGKAAFVVIDEPQRYNLPDVEPDKQGMSVYGVTWTHQYHCLVSD